MKRLTLSALNVAAVQAAIPFIDRDRIWARLQEYAHVVVLELRVLIWVEKVTLGDLFPLLKRILGPPPVPLPRDTPR